MQNVLVTGGGGFLGSAIVRQLLAEGCTVTVAGRHHYPHVEALGAACLIGDVADKSFTQQLCKGIDTVFHVAAKAGIWGDWREYEKTNVEGTVNITQSCINKGVTCLVYTSTPSVVFDRKDIELGDENLPYAKKFLCGYSASKVAAERYVLQQAGETMRVCAIRPHLIWGPGDPHLLPRLVERGKSGNLKIVGNGTNKVDITYVDNAAQAHVLAAQNLHVSGGISGRAYFIGQERPVLLWEWINELFRSLGIAEVKNRVPLGVAYFGGWALELLHSLRIAKGEPKMTRFLAQQLARSHYFSHNNAEQDFGYKPVISIEDGMKKVVDWLN